MNENNRYIYVHISKAKYLFSLLLYFATFKQNWFLYQHEKQQLDQIGVGKHKLKTQR